MNLSILVVTSIHDDYDKRIWRHALSLTDIGYHVNLVCPWEISSHAKSSFVVIHPFKRVLRRWQRPFLIPLRVWNRMRPLLKEVDVIHFHDIDLLPWMAIIALFKPVVYDVHENYADEMLVRDWIPRFLRLPLYWIVKVGQNIFSRIIKNIVLVTDAQKTDFSGRSINSIIIRNYASTKLVEYVNNDYLDRDPVVIFPGSQYENNGSILLLDIAQIVRNKIPGIKFLISDAFESMRFRERYINEVNKRQLEDTISILPLVPSSEIVQLLNSASIAINPVLRVRKQIRAINTKLFEFMAAGIPFVTSDLPYPKELIRETNAGLLAQPESPESFANQICRLVEDKKLAYSLGRNGKKKFIESYSWESQVSELNDYYQNIIALKI